MQIPGDTTLNGKSVEGFIASVVNKYVVRPTGSPNIIGAGGFIFDILDNEEASLDSDITDHFVEDNYAIQDHIAIRPIKFTLKGYIAELSNIAQQPLLGILQSAQSLASVPGIGPIFSTQTTQAYSKIVDVTAKANNVINQANNIFDIFNSKSTTATKQQKAYKFFKNLWETQQLVSVETPFEVYKNMAIEKISVTQKGDTKMVSDFSITFKQFRTVKSLFNASTVPLLSGRAASANSQAISHGQISGDALQNTTATAVLKNYYPGSL